MNPSLALEILARATTAVGRDRHGNLLTLDAPQNLLTTLRDLDLTTDLVLAIAGTATGHRWATCPTCSRTQLISSNHNCHLTPRCPGKLRSTRRKNPPSLSDGLCCCRPGCTTPAHHLTAGLEPVCHLDFLHLALLQQEHQ